MMARHNMVGKKGEGLAVEYFVAKQYKILHTNWRKQYLEVDILAAKDNILHIIEVKTKSSNKNGFPEDEVTPQKIKHLMEAAEAFLFENPQWKRIQFDILSITLFPSPTFFLIEDVFL